MIAMVISFKHMCMELKKDGILFLLLPVPLLCAIIIYFGLPFAEKQIEIYFKVSEFLTPYYGIFYQMVMITPSLIFTYAAVMKGLDEFDDGTAKYLCVTPLGKTGYLLSRYVLPNAIAVIYAAWLGLFFPVIELPFLAVIVVSLLSGMQGIIISMIATVVPSNKVEGMALIKLSSLILLGMPVPYFLFGTERYAASVFPSFWLSEYIRCLEEGIGGSFRPILPVVGTAVAAVWFFLLFKKLEKKII